MKKLLIAALSAMAFCLPVIADTVDATYYFSDFTTRPLNVKRVTITPLAASADYQGTNLSNRPIIYNYASYPSLTNGYFTATNLIAGYAYKVAFSDGFAEPNITNYFGTNVSGAVDGNDYKTTYIHFVNGSIIQVWYAYLSNTNSASTQTNISYTAITNLTSFGALTNNETRDVSLLGEIITIGGSAAAQVIVHDPSTEVRVTGDIRGSGLYLTNIPGTALTSASVATQKVDATFYQLLTNANVTQAGLAAGSYDIAVAHALTFTNITLIPTQQVVVVTSQNTNIIYATLAGTTAARGTYYWRAAQDSYTNSTGCGIYFDGADYLVTNATGNLYYSGAFVDLSWTEDLGASPAIATTYGTNSTTYTQNSITTAGLFPSSKFSSNVVFVATDGSDQFGERGNPQRPFLTLQSAITNAQIGDIIFIQPGSYSVGDVSVTSRSIVGSGRLKTILTGRLNLQGTNIVLKDLSMLASGTLPISVGFASTGATNTVLENCYIQGSEDGIYLNKYDGLKAFNLDIESRWDCVADYQSDGNTNALAEFFGCRLYSHASTFNATPVTIGPTRMRFNGGSITASNGASGLVTSCFYSGSTVSELGRGARIEVNNVKLLYGSTNHTAKAIHARTNMAIVVSGFTIPNSDIVGSTNVSQLDALNIGTNSTAVSANISLYFTNQDGTVYRVSAQRIVP